MQISKSILPVTLLFFLCLLCGCIPSFAKSHSYFDEDSEDEECRTLDNIESHTYFSEDSEDEESYTYFITELEDEECGTLDDPNYYAAFKALREAADVCCEERSVKDFRTGSHFFPQAGDGVLDLWGEPVFYCEGELSWSTSSGNVICRRILQKAVQIDVPVYIFQRENPSFLYPPEPSFIEENQVFHLYKDYSALLSAFCSLQQDLTFVYQSEKAFLQRRFKDFQDYYISGTNGFHRAIPLKKSDLEKNMLYFENQYQKYKQRLGEFQK
jgi:hypothetical protein